MHITRTCKIEHTPTNAHVHTHTHAHTPRSSSTQAQLDAAQEALNVANQKAEAAKEAHAKVCGGGLS